VPTTLTVRKIEWSAVGEMSDSDTDGLRAVFADSTGSLFFGDLAGHRKRMIFKAEPDRAPEWTPARDFAMACIRLQSKPNHPGVLAVVKTDGTGYRELIRDDAEVRFLGPGLMLRGHGTIATCWSEPPTSETRAGSCGW